jgi:hypothetical protein
VTRKQTERVGRRIVENSGPISSRKALSENSVQLGIGLVQPFRYDSHLGNHRHEVGIAAPSGHDMNVHVGIDARACHLAYIGSYVKALGTESVFQDPNAKFHESHHRSTFFVREVFQAGDVPIRDYHEVTVAVGISIEHDHPIFSTVEEVILPVLTLGYLIA